MAPAPAPFAVGGRLAHRARADAARRRRLHPGRAALTCCAAGRGALGSGGVFELGYRGQPVARLSYSATACSNRYDDLRTQEVDPTRLHVTFGNLMEGKARGLEMWGSYQASRLAHLSAGFTLLHETLAQARQQRPGRAGQRSGKDPEHTAQLRSSFALAMRKDLELAVRKVGRWKIPPRCRATRRSTCALGWRLRASWNCRCRGEPERQPRGVWGGWPPGRAGAGRCGSSWCGRTKEKSAAPCLVLA
jgi:hypothetical protein